MAFTQSDVDALDRAIAAGELEVENNGRRVKYRSIAELLKARELMIGEVTAAAGNRPTGVFRYDMTTLRGE
jgi:hypothetical protein